MTESGRRSSNLSDVATAPLRAPFALNRAAFERITRLVETAPARFAVTAPADRRAAFERLASARPPFVLPDAELIWQAGRISLATRPLDARDPDDDQTALATENAGGVMHFGAIEIATPAGAAQAAGAIVASLSHITPELMTQLSLLRAEFTPLPTTRFTAAAQAFENCGALIVIPDDLILSAPLQLVWTYPEGAAHAVFPRIIVHIGKRAAVQIIERHLGDGDAFVAGICELRVADGATLDYSVVQHVSENTRFHMTRMHSVAESAQLHCRIAELGGDQNTLRVHSRQSGAAATHTLGMFALRTGTQKLDVITSSDQQRARTRADETIRVAITDRGMVRLKNTIRLRKKAAEAHASSDHRGLLFSARAKFESAPHRLAQHHAIHVRQATQVGSFDEETLFYLLSRGISRSEAVRMVTLAFFEPAIAGLPSELLKDEVRTALDDDIDRLTARWDGVH